MAMPLVLLNVSLYIILLKLFFITSWFTYISTYAMSRHSIMKLASNNGQKVFFPLIYGNHKSCGVICSLTKHLMNPVNALKEGRIVNPIESNFIVN